jgi:hypothetical protein
MDNTTNNSWRTYHHCSHLVGSARRSNRPFGSFLTKTYTDVISHNAGRVNSFLHKQNPVEMLMPLGER